ncbi:uncharacterized protein LOC131175262 [Hevea brasiliensis]|uniref:uncharacterized protein LOC131175262 n=1 Tax=Hevea brasiliensis TaxID=3981 RepID=UPI0025DCE450|nr:uncharacterized protein LOC131175262 [Hevea brasiliensis]
MTQLLRQVTGAIPQPQPPPPPPPRPQPPPPPVQPPPPPQSQPIHRSPLDRLQKYVTVDFRDFSLLVASALDVERVRNEEQSRKDRQCKRDSGSGLSGSADTDSKRPKESQGQIQGRGKKQKSQFAPRRGGGQSGVSVGNSPGAATQGSAPPLAFQAGSLKDVVTQNFEMSAENKEVSNSTLAPTLNYTRTQPITPSKPCFAPHEHFKMTYSRPSNDATPQSNPKPITTTDSFPLDQEVEFITRSERCYENDKREKKKGKVKIGEPQENMEDGALRVEKGEPAEPKEEEELLL